MDQTTALRTTGAAPEHKDAETREDDHERPPFTFDPSQWERLARDAMPTNAWGYAYGNGGTGTTCSRNLAAFDRWAILSRRLRPSRKDEQGQECFSDTSTKVLGQELACPFALAPVGVQTIFHQEGELATARAAASETVPFILSTVGSMSIEDVAEASGPQGTRWFQLYWLGREHKDITASLLRRAKVAGYTTLFVTLDTFAVGWRPSDLDNGYDPFGYADCVGTAIGLTDPVFQAKFMGKQELHGDGQVDSNCKDEDHEDPGYPHESAQRRRGLGHAAREWEKIAFPGHSLAWSDIAFLQEHWDGPIVLKGIQTVADAEMCVEAGVQGIVVSNHGGRHQDGGASSLGVLPGIARAVGHRLDIFFDSGVRCGADVLIALALGAKCVLIGRPYVYGLALAGEDGVRHVVRAMMGDLVRNMHLAGIRNIGEIHREMVVREDELF